MAPRIVDTFLPKNEARRPPWARFGAAPPRSLVGVYTGTNPQNRNAMGFLGLDARDVEELVDADDETLA